MELTGIFFDIARDVLGELIKAAISKKVKKVVEEEVRIALIEHYTKVQPQAVSGNINIETLNILLDEVYSIASVSRGLKVAEGSIRIQTSHRPKIPQSIREMEIARRVKRMKSEIAIQTNEELSHNVIDQSLESAGKQHEQPLMFSDNEPPAEDLNAKSKDISTIKIVNHYRAQIHNIIEEEEKNQDKEK